MNGLSRLSGLLELEETQKRKYFGEFFPAQMPEGASGRVFLEFFQTDRETGKSKDIVGLDLQEADL